MINHWRRSFEGDYLQKMGGGWEKGVGSVVNNDLQMNSRKYEGGAKGAFADNRNQLSDLLIRIFLQINQQTVDSQTFIQINVYFVQKITEIALNIK